MLNGKLSLAMNGVHAECARSAAARMRGVWIFRHEHLLRSCEHITSCSRKQITKTLSKRSEYEAGLIHLHACLNEHLDHLVFSL